MVLRALASFVLGVLSTVATGAEIERWPMSEPRWLTLSAADGTRLSLSLHQGAQPKPRVLVVAPGFGQRGGIRPIKIMAGLLSPTADVLVLDFRGTGDSGGRYQFGADEAQDLQAALAWARSRWKGVDVLGLSLGGHIAVRAAAEGPLAPDRLLLMSPATRVDDVVWSGAILKHPWTMLWRRETHHPDHEADFLFRWGSLLAAKPAADALAPKLRVPAHFLVGAKDTLILPRDSRRIYEAIPGPKTWTEWPEGLHAEQLALYEPEAFRTWATTSLRSPIKREP